jgi:hypothetical protein
MFGELMLIIRIEAIRTVGALKLETDATRATRATVAVDSGAAGAT